MAVSVLFIKEKGYCYYQGKSTESHEEQKSIHTSCPNIKLPQYLSGSQTSTLSLYV